MHTSQRSNNKSTREPEKDKIRFHPLATDEFIAATKFYENQRTGLGDKYVDAVEKTLKLISINPLIGKLDKEGNRRFRVTKFPYLLIYKIKEEKIFILAVAHTSRKPEYWKDRYF